MCRCPNESEIWTGDGENPGKHHVHARADHEDDVCYTAEEPEKPLMFAQLSECYYRPVSRRSCLTYGNDFHM